MNISKLTAEHDDLPFAIIKLDYDRVLVVPMYQAADIMNAMIYGTFKTEYRHYPFAEALTPIKNDRITVEAVTGAELRKRLDPDFPHAAANDDSSEPSHAEAAGQPF